MSEYNYNEETSMRHVDFEYISDMQDFIIPETGEYILEAWGAQGGTYSEGLGKGGYSKGVITLSKDDVVRVMVGGSGETSSESADDNGLKEVYASGGWNGGGNSGGGGYKAGSGGGATDMRILGTSLMHRVIVAGGGGGQGNSNGIPGDGGGSFGLPSSEIVNGRFYRSTGGIQELNANESKRFGNGGENSYDNHSGGGGGGWIGGEPGSVNSASGAGGSGYIYTKDSYKPSPKDIFSYKRSFVEEQLSSKHFLSKALMIPGNKTMPDPNGGVMVGNSGSGFARITYIKQ